MRNFFDTLWNFAFKGQKTKIWRKISNMMIMPTVLYFGVVVLIFLLTVFVFRATDSLVTRVGLIVTFIGVILPLIFTAKGQIKVAFGRRRFEKLAAEVYRAEGLTEAKIFSIVDTFRAPTVYIDAFRNSKAKSIEIIGSAVPNTASFLGGIFRLIMAQASTADVKIHNVDHSRIRVKYVISEENGKPQSVVLGGNVGRASRYGIDVCDLNPQIFDLLRKEFDDLLPHCEPMEDYIKMIVLNSYYKTPEEIKTIGEFVERVLVQEEVSCDFQKKYGENVLKEVVNYVGKLVKNHAKDQGAKLSIGDETRVKEAKQFLEFLKKRAETKEAHQPMSIILDLTYFCNLDCEGCGVDVKFVKDRSDAINWELSFSDAKAVMQGIARFARERNVADNVRFCIGGGEPTLHPDFKRIVRYAEELFGSRNVSFDTNGTVLSTEDLQKIAPYVGNIGIGLDGDAEYHDKWRNYRGESGLISVFRKVTELIEATKKYSEIMDKIEIVFTPTARNCHEFKHVARIARKLGIKRLSCHRFMLTGRARNKPELEPSAKQYLKLFSDTVTVQEELGLEVHFHHSFEELLCRVLDSDACRSDVISPCKVRRASLCISADLKMHFCPWFVAHPFNNDALSVSIRPFLKMDDEKMTFYDISEAISSLQRYNFEKCICPIAAANTRLRKSGGQPIPKDELVKCLSAEDNCERQVRAAFESKIGLV